MRSTVKLSAVQSVVVRATRLAEKGELSRVIESMRIKTSFIQNIPFATEKYRYFLPIFPIATFIASIPSVAVKIL